MGSADTPAAGSWGNGSGACGSPDGTSRILLPSRSNTSRANRRPVGSNGPASGARDSSERDALWRSSSSCCTRLARVIPTTSAPDTTSAIASKAPSRMSSRARRVMSVGRNEAKGKAGRSGGLGAKRVAKPSNRPDQLVVPGVQLAAQVADVRLDDVVVAVEVVLPHVVEDLLLRKHPLRVEQEVAQQSELCRRKSDL